VQLEPASWQHGAAPQQFGAANTGLVQAITIIAENNPTIGFGKSKGGKMRKSGKFVYKKTTIKIVPLYSA